MPLDNYCQPWAGETFRHIAADYRNQILDFSEAGRSARNRWNKAGEPTLYLAGDVGVAVAEWGRHIRVDRSAAIAVRVLDRLLFRLDVEIDGVIDLRDRNVLQSLSIEDSRIAFLDVSVARRTAAEVRRNSTAKGVIVPTVAFLDDPSRWNLVLFLEKLPSDVRTFIIDVQPVGRLGLT